MRATTATLLALVLLLGGCSDDQSEAIPTTTKAPPASNPTTASEPTTGNGPPAMAEPPDIEHAVRTYTRAFADGETDTAWDLVSQRCQANLPRPTYAAAIDDAARRYPDLEVTTIAASVDGERARVTYDTTAADDGIAYVDQPWVLEEGSWRWDAC